MQLGPPAARRCPEPLLKSDSCMEICATVAGQPPPLQMQAECTRPGKLLPEHFAAASQPRNRNHEAAASGLLATGRGHSRVRTRGGGWRCPGVRRHLQRCCDGAGRCEGRWCNAAVGVAIAPMPPRSRLQPPSPLPLSCLPACSRAATWRRLRPPVARVRADALAGVGSCMGARRVGLASLPLVPPFLPLAPAVLTLPHPRRLLGQRHEHRHHCHPRCAAPGALPCGLACA